MASPIPTEALTKLAKMKAKYPTATVHRVGAKLFWRISTAQKEATKQDTSVNTIHMGEYEVGA